MDHLPLVAIPVDVDSASLEALQRQRAGARTWSVALNSLGFTWVVATILAVPAGIVDTAWMPVAFWGAFVCCGLGTAEMAIARGHSVFWGLAPIAVGAAYRLLFATYLIQPLLAPFVLPYVLLPFLLEDDLDVRIKSIEARINGTVQPRTKERKYLAGAIGLPLLALTAPFGVWYAVMAIHRKAQRNLPIVTETVVLFWAIAWLVVPILLGLFLFSRYEAPAPERVLSAGELQMTLLPGWRDSPELRSTTPLQLSIIHPEHDICLGVSVVNKSDVASSMSTDFLAAQITHLRNTFNPFQLLSGPQRTTFAGSPAWDFESECVADGMALRTRHLITETSNSYYIITCWTLKSKYASNVSEMNEAIGRITVLRSP